MKNILRWIEEIYGSDEIIFGESENDWEDDEYSKYGFFDFSKWMEYEHGKETVKDFINYLYESIDELPQQIINKI